MLAAHVGDAAAQALVYGGALIAAQADVDNVQAGELAAFHQAIQVLVGLHDHGRVAHPLAALLVEHA